MLLLVPTALNQCCGFANLLACRGYPDLCISRGSWNDLRIPKHLQSLFRYVWISTSKVTRYIITVNKANSGRFGRINFDLLSITFSVANEIQVSHSNFRVAYMKNKPLGFWSYCLWYQILKTSIIDYSSHLERSGIRVLRVNPAAAAYCISLLVTDHE